MSYRKFGKNDVLVNTLRSHPKQSFYIYNGKILYNNKGTKTGHFRLHPNNVYMTETGYENLYEYNIDRHATDNPLIYPFIDTVGDRTEMRMTWDYDADAEAFSLASYEGVVTGTYPQFASIRREWITTPSGSCVNMHKDACFHNFSYFSLKNYLNHYSTLSPHYAVEMPENYNGGWNKDEQEFGLIHIPSILYGTKIKPGTVKLRFYMTGSLIGELQDEKENGELIQTLPTGSIHSGSVAGVILYNEGFALLTGSWAIDPGAPRLYFSDTGSNHPAWKYWGAGARDGVGVDASARGGTTDMVSASYSIDFEGTTKTQVVTMNAHAPRGKVNFSNNPSFLKKGQRLYNVTSSHIYEENTTKEIKNTVSSSFATQNEKFSRQVYISKVGIYDENKNLLGVASLADPVLKEENQNFTFRIKLDI